MGHGQHHSSGESHRRHKDRSHRHKHRSHGYDAVPVGKPYAAPANGKPVVGKLVEPPPSKGAWPPSSRRRRSNRFWTATSAITTLAFVLFAVGCMAGGWLLMRSVLGKGNDVAKDTGTQVAKADTAKKTEAAAATKPAEQPKPTEAKTPAPETKAAPPAPETKAKTPDPKPPEPAPKPPEPAPKPPEPAGDPSVPVVAYDKDIKAIMESRCNRCHGDGTAKPKGGLDTRTLAAIIKGGGNGKGVVPGDPKKSSIWMSIEDKEMPPKGEPQLSEDQKKLIFNWIKGGAREKAGDAVAAGPAIGYEKHILPMLTQKCGKCHDGIEKSGGLDVTTLATLKKGGGNGAAIVPGDLKKSILWEYVAVTKQMPPEGKGVPLSEAELDKLKAWIMAGAKDNKEAMIVAAK